MKKKILIALIIFIAAVSALGAVSIRPYGIVDISYSYTYELSPWDSITFRGKEYTQGVYFNYYKHSSNTKNPRVLYNLENRFRDVVCTVAMNTNDTRDCDTSFVKFYLDGKLIKTVNLKKGQAVQTITIPLDYRNQLQIELGCYAFVADMNFR